MTTLQNIYSLKKLYMIATGHWNLECWSKITIFRCQIENQTFIQIITDIPKTNSLRKDICSFSLTGINTNKELHNKTIIKDHKLFVPVSGFKDASVPKWILSMEILIVKHLVNPFLYMSKYLYCLTTWKSYSFLGLAI